MKCVMPGCPYPALGEWLCAQHIMERSLPLTLHETSCGGYVRLDENEDWTGFRVMNGPGSHKAAELRTARISLQRKLRFEMNRGRPGRPKLTDEEKKLRQYTHCMARLPNGIRCNARIPLKERVCAECLKRLLPVKEK